MKLRIAINGRKIEGPYGGGNQFAQILEQVLLGCGHEVFRTLVPGLDLILIVSTHYHPKTTSFSIETIRDYLALNPKTAVVHRINSLDEPRGQDQGVNRAVLDTNPIADHTIFISQFLKEAFGHKGLDLTRPNSVILNGADEKIFHPHGGSTWMPGQKLRFVTHHWSPNYLKGFDVYERFDLLLAEEPYRDLFEFELIGNLPLGLEMKQASLVPPIYGHALADRLRQSHMYLTAARYEAAGMHHIEGMLCGLPVLYLNSGALPEYCQPFGLEFNLINFEHKLLETLQQYPRLKQSVAACPYTGSRMAQKYAETFQLIVEHKRTLAFKNPTLIQRMKIHLVSKPFREARKIQALLKRAWQSTHD